MFSRTFFPIFISTRDVNVEPLSAKFLFGIAVVLGIDIAYVVVVFIRDPDSTIIVVLVLEPDFFASSLLVVIGVVHGNGAK